MTAELAGTSHDTFEKAKYILEKGSEELKEKVSRGDISINKAFTYLKSKKLSEEQEGIELNDVNEASDATASSDVTVEFETEESEVIDDTELAELAELASDEDMHSGD